MKRLSLLVGIFVLATVLFGGGLNAERVSAAVTDSDYNTIVNEVTTGFASVNLGSIPNGDSIRTEILQSFITSSAGTYNVLKRDSSTTAPILREKVFGILKTDLMNMAKSGVGGSAGQAKRDVAQRLATPIVVLYDKAVGQINVAAGVLSQEEADKENAAQAGNAVDRANNVATTQANRDAPKKCTSFLTSSIIDCIDAGVAWFITNTLLGIAGWILWLAATMMNYSIDLGILQFSKWATDDLYPIWTIMRQIVSLFVVFAGLYLGFIYILGDEKKIFERYVPFVVLFALFVNFSYPIVRTAVDLSNVISLNIYTSAVGSGALDSKVDPEKTAGAIIRSRLGLSGIIDFTTGNTKKGEDTLNSIRSTPAALLAVAFVFYAAYIFFMVTILMALRTAALVILIVASPLLLIDSVIPKLGEISVKMRKILFEQLAVAPVFTIMLALTLKFLDVFQSGPLQNTALSGINAGESGTKMFFNLLMMLIMLHIMLKVTKSVSGSMGEYASNVVGTVGGFATSAAIGAATGGTGLLARASIGRAAAAVRDSSWVTNNQAGEGVRGSVTGFLGRRMYDMSNSVAKSSFDLRNSSVLAGSAKSLGISTKGMGVGVKGGYEEELSRKVEDRKSRYGRIKTDRVYNDDSNLTPAENEARRREVEAKNQAGMMAKRTFFNSGGGTLGNTNTKVKEALLDEDRAEATKYNESINRYNKLGGDKKQDYFTAIKDPSIKNQILAIDRAKAEESDAKTDVYNASVNGRRQAIYNNDMSPEEQARAKAIDETLARKENESRDEQKAESEAKLDVYGATKGQRRQDIYTYDMSPEEQARARATDETLARKENEQRDNNKNPDAREALNTYRWELTGQAKQDYYNKYPEYQKYFDSSDKNKAEEQEEYRGQTGEERQYNFNTMHEHIQPDMLNMDEVEARKENEKRNQNTSSTVGDTTINSTTTNNTIINNTSAGSQSSSSIPPGYTQNPGGVVLVPTNIRQSRPSSSTLEGGTSSDTPSPNAFKGAPLVSTSIEEESKNISTEEINSIVEKLIPLNEDARKNMLKALNPRVADRVRNDPRLKAEHHDAKAESVMDLFLE